MFENEDWNKLLKMINDALIGMVFWSVILITVFCLVIVLVIWT